MEGLEKIGEDRYRATEISRPITEEPIEGTAEDLVPELEDVGADALAEAGETFLDASGVGALLGVPLQVASAVGMGVGIYDMGKDAVDWFKNDILGDKPSLPQPLSLAQKGGLVVPTFDSVSNIPSGVGSW